MEKGQPQKKSNPKAAVGDPTSSKHVNTDLPVHLLGASAPPPNFHPAKKLQCAALHVNSACQPTVLIKARSTLPRTRTNHDANDASDAEQWHRSPGNATPGTRLLGLRADAPVAHQPTREERLPEMMMGSLYSTNVESMRGSILRETCPNHPEPSGAGQVYPLRSSASVIGRIQGPTMVSHVWQGFQSHNQNLVIFSGIPKPM